MVANSTTINLDPSAAAVNIASRMEVLAVKGDWDQVQTLVNRIKHTLLEVPEHERGGVLLEVMKTLDRIKTITLTSRHDVTDKLSEIRRGRVATQAYGRSSGGAVNSALR